ncbi:superoxide dismutase [Lentzea jiangxiensis]|nr:superoxide dismutase [Lentzea jiangxiensis]
MGTLLTLLVTAALFAAPAAAAPVPAERFPAVVNLPNGFSPEGIAVDGKTAYTGSLANGAIRRVDLRTGVTTQFAPSPGPGKISVGMDVDRFGRLWVAGGGHGGPLPGVLSSFRLYDTRSGAKLADVLVPEASFINDVEVTRDAAWFTDSADPAALVRVPIGTTGRVGVAEKIVLGGGWVPGGPINANGITATPDGENLLVGQTAAAGGGAALYLVPSTTGDVALARKINLQGDLESADGLVLVGRTLYVVTHDGVVEVELARQLTAGRVLGVTEVPGAAFASTGAVFGGRLYVVDANLGENLSNIGNPDATFKIVAIPVPWNRRRFVGRAE